ncbi:MAG TPA: DUF885 domain-containing protein [Pseudonocardiaceae bacterium]
MAQTQSGVHEISDRFVSEYVALHPIFATYAGLPGHDDKLTDYAPEGHAGRAELARSALAEMTAAVPADPAEQVAKAVFTERIGLALELHEAKLDVSAFNIIDSPVQDVRQVFDLMPTETTQDWATIAARLAAVPDALGGISASLAYAASAGRPAAIRQVERIAGQCETWAGVTGEPAFFDQLVTKADGVPGVTETLQRDLENAARAATKAYAELATYLREDLASKATPRDAVGEEVYRLQSRNFLGATIDLDEAYTWGWDEFARIEAEMKRVAGRISPGASMAEAAQRLDADARYQISGRDEFAAWLQGLSDRALGELRGVHFDIPDEVMRLECKIAPPGGGVGAYYTSPSEDFSRPGRMWWSVPADKHDFTTWREVTTVYHEGAPGHHLQCAIALCAAGKLNTFQRLMCWISGHGEGWALYAERLMRELGYLGDDGDLLGMLDGQLFRAARVVVDLGMHLELPIPAGYGFHEGERWTPELGLEFMLNRTINDPHHVHDEIDRYLGWPGQAPSYKLGERLWLSARDEARARAASQGRAFDLKAFHTAALEMGSMGLDTLREQLATL